MDPREHSSPSAQPSHKFMSGTDPDRNVGDLPQVPGVLGCLPKLLFRHCLTLFILILNSTLDWSRKEAKQAYNEFVKKHSHDLSGLQPSCYAWFLCVHASVWENEREHDREMERELCMFAVHVVAVFTPDGPWNSIRWLKAPHVRKTHSFSLSDARGVTHRGINKSLLCLCLYHSSQALKKPSGNNAPLTHSSCQDDYTLVNRFKSMKWEEKLCFCQ